MTRFHHDFLEDDEVLDDPYFAGRQRWEREHAFAQALKERGRHPLDTYRDGYRSRAWEQRRTWSIGTWTPGISSVSAAMASLFSSTSGTAISAVGHAGQGLARALRITAIGFVTVFLAAATSLGAYIGTNWDRITTQIALVRQNVDCSKTIALRDGAGALIHVVPLLPDTDCPQPANVNGDPLARPVLTVPFGEPEAMAHAEAFRSIEGALWVDETLWGHDWRGPLRRLRGVVRELVTGQEDRSGVTGPIATVFENLSHAHDLSIGEKVLSMVAASVYTSRYLATDADRITFVNLAPAVVNAVPHRAGELASLAMLGTSAPVSLADQCRFARAAGLPVPMVGARGVTDHIASRWAGHVGPGAARCVRYLAGSEPEADEAFAELRSLCGGDDFCLEGEPHWHLLEEADRHAAQASWTAMRRQLVAREAIPYVELPNAFGGSTTTLRDTILLDGNVDGLTSLRPSVQTAVLRAIRGSYASWSSRGMTGIEAAVAVFDISDTNVSPLGVYGERTGAIYPPHIIAQNDAPEMGLPPWYGASMNKIAIMMVAVREGVMEICLSRGACVSLADAFGRSDNEVFLALARQLDPQLRAFREALGYLGDVPEEPSLRARDAVYGFATRLPPYRFAVLFAALLHREAQSTHLVGDTAFGTSLDLAQLGFTDANRSTILEIAAAPLAPGGTLHAVAQAMHLPSGCAVIGGKTGTHSVDGANLQRGSVLLVQCDERYFVTFALAAHAERLGLRHRDLAPIHAAAATAAADLE